MTNLAYFLTCKWRVFHTLFYFEKSIITLQTHSFSSFDICLKRLSLWPIESRTLQFRSLKQCSLPLIIIATENRPVSCTLCWSSLKKNLKCFNEIICDQFNVCRMFLYTDWVDTERCEHGPWRNISHWQKYNSFEWRWCKFMVVCTGIKTWVQ